ITTLPAELPTPSTSIASVPITMLSTTEILFAAADLPINTLSSDRACVPDVVNLSTTRKTAFPAPVAPTTGSAIVTLLPETAVTTALPCSVSSDPVDTENPTVSPTAIPTLGIEDNVKTTFDPEML